MRCYDPVPRGLRFACDDGQLLLQDGIQQGALPGIGLPNDGYIACTIHRASWNAATKLPVRDGPHPREASCVQCRGI